RRAIGMLPIPDEPLERRAERVEIRQRVVVVRVLRVPNQRHAVVPGTVAWRPPLRARTPGVGGARRCRSESAGNICRTRSSDRSSGVYFYPREGPTATLRCPRYGVRALTLNRLTRTVQAKFETRCPSWVR